MKKLLLALVISLPAAASGPNAAPNTGSGQNAAKGGASGPISPSGPNGAMKGVQGSSGPIPECMADRQKLCSSFPNGSQELRQCMEKHQAELSSACREARDRRKADMKQQPGMQKSQNPNQPQGSPGSPPLPGSASDTSASPGSKGAHP